MPQFLVGSGLKSGSDSTCC